MKAKTTALRSVAGTRHDAGSGDRAQLLEQTTPTLLLRKGLPHLRSGDFGSPVLVCSIPHRGEGDRTVARAAGRADSPKSRPQIGRQTMPATVWQTFPIARNLATFRPLSIVPDIAILTEKSKVTILTVPMLGE
jgi:hypothetical protein